MEKLRVGIAGLGNFGELHLLAFAQLPYVRITRLCSRSETRARELAQRFQVPHISTDRQEFAQSDDVDLVSVVTASSDHAAVAIPALEAGKHVLIEKPMAASLEDAEAIVAAAQKAYGKCMVAHICRFQAPFYHAKRLIDAGELGEIALIQSWRNNHYSLVKPGRFQNPLRETAIHDIDLALWYTGSEIAEVSGFKSFHHTRELADTGCALVRLRNGTICTFASSWLRRDAQPSDLDARLKIVGTRGEIEINQPPRNFTQFDDHAFHFVNPEVVRDPVIMQQTGLMAEIAYFCRCVLEDQAPTMVTPEDALRTLRAAAQIDAACRPIHEQLGR